MRPGSPLAHLPIVIGIVLSIVAHAAALYLRGDSEPPRLELETGRTVVQLTLIPSVAAQPAAVEPIPQPDPEPTPEPAPEPIVEATPLPVPTPEPVIEPTPEPVAETTPEPVMEPTPDPPAVESVEHIASTIADKGVEMEAAPVSRIRPSYPRAAQKRGHEGTVLLSIEVRANGTAGNVSILESSGHNLLDSAALKAAKKARYTPAMQRGHAVESVLIQPIIFQLNE